MENANGINIISNMDAIWSFKTHIKNGNSKCVLQCNVIEKHCRGGKRLFMVGTCQKLRTVCITAIQGTNFNTSDLKLLIKDSRVEKLVEGTAADARAVWDGGTPEKELTDNVRIDIAVKLVLSERFNSVQQISQICEIPMKRLMGEDRFLLALSKKPIMTKDDADNEKTLIECNLLAGYVCENDEELFEKAKEFITSILVSVGENPFEERKGMTYESILTCSRGMKKISKDIMENGNISALTKRERTKYGIVPDSHFRHVEKTITTCHCDLFNVCSFDNGEKWENAFYKATGYAIFDNYWTFSGKMVELEDNFMVASIVKVEKKYALVVGYISHQYRDHGYIDCSMNYPFATIYDSRKMADKVLRDIISSIFVRSYRRKQSNLFSPEDELRRYICDTEHQNHIALCQKHIAMGVVNKLSSTLLTKISGCHVHID